jgi:hypothetical protein
MCGSVLWMMTFNSSCQYMASGHHTVTWCFLEACLEPQWACVANGSTVFWGLPYMCLTVCACFQSMSVNDLVYIAMI